VAVDVFLSWCFGEPAMSSFITADKKHCCLSPNWLEN
jgi:hypothetical protein